jgi:Uma2 family endonuclease
MMSPAGWRHGAVVGNLHSLLGSYIRTRRLGRVFGAETGFQLSREPDTVRAPDLAFVTAANLPEEDPTEAYWPGAPDLAVEVLSPGDTVAQVDEKIAAWLSAGAALVWVLDPVLRCVTIYRALTDVTVRPAGTKLEGEAVVPGFVCEVEELFAE